tara:strand:- start:328 stop:777 length:450 start_codon:yes stop_codon:yes gene_type:complete
MNFIRRFSNCNNKLHNIDEQKLKNFVPKIKECKVIKVYDGDTITIAAYLKGDPECYKFKVRLNGIDSAEIKGSSENEKKHAIQARDALSDKILHQIVKLDIKGLEKYGRILADVFYNGENMNEWMLNNGYAVKYNGGTKKRDKKWDKEL